MDEIKILGISGSLRDGSYNTALLHAAARHAPQNLTVEVYDCWHFLPYYNEGLDTDPPPSAVRRLRATIGAADAILIASPEYNFSIPGGLKNALDWASRPADHWALRHKPVAIMGATLDDNASIRGHLALRQVLHATECDVVAKPEVLLARAAERFDETGQLIDHVAIRLLRELLTAVATRAEQARAAHV